MTLPDTLATRPSPILPPATGPSTAANETEPNVGRSTGGIRAYLSKYMAIFRVSFAERMTYRVDFLIGTVLRFLPMITTILLWQAIYDGSKPAGAAGANEFELGGFRYREMIAYLLLTNISRMFSSMPGLAGGVAREIREGTMKRYLVQPIDMIGYLVAYRIAHKITYIITSFVPYFILFFVCRSYFDGFPDALTLAAFAAALVVSFLVGFFFEASVGMVGFWFLEVTSLLYIVMTLNFFISGHMLPLDLLPEPWRTILIYLPFQYMAYFPAVVFLGKVKGAALVFHLLVGLAWAFFFIVLARVLYRLGLRRYSAFGG
jgi:ABC-2 type transport system permease protein